LEKSNNYAFLYDQAHFVETESIKDLSRRALAYLRSGLAVNFSGPAGVGKTSLALHVAGLLGRPVVLLHGNDELRGVNLLGGDYGYRRRKMIDNFVHTVYLLEEDLQYRWVEGRLTAACRNGYTLVYDEFTRSRPEANNFLLSILGEGILSLPSLSKDSPYVPVHPEFRMIFTSNPEEYAGVHKLQVALEDRLVTLEIKGFDRETEISIVTARTGLPEEEAGLIVDLVRAVRQRLHSPEKVSVRSSLRIAQVLKTNQIAVDDPLFQSICMDILFSDLRNLPGEKREEARQVLNEFLQTIQAPGVEG